MTLRRHRRDVVIWRASRSPDYRGHGVWFTRAGHSGRVRRRLRITGLLVAVGLLRVVAAVRPRWRPLAVGTALTVAGYVMRNGMPGVIMIPGMVTQSNVMVEHPEVIAQRLGRWIDAFGQERVIAGTDCGFASFAGNDEIHESIVWAKLKALVDGARIASKEIVAA